jgi:hypothetical protein
VETTSKKEKTRRKKPHTPKPKKQGGMPELRHYPHAKYHEDRNPKYREEQHKDVV